MGFFDSLLLGPGEVRRPRRSRRPQSEPAAIVVEPVISDALAKREAEKKEDKRDDPSEKDTSEKDKKEKPPKEGTKQLSDEELVAAWRIFLESEKRQNGNTRSKDGESATEATSVTSGDTSKTERSSQPEGWTKEEDGKLRELKESGASWGDIGKELSKSKKALSKRWHELQQEGASSAASDAGTEQISTAGSEASEKKEKDDKKKNDGGLPSIPLYPKVREDGRRDIVKELEAMRTHAIKSAKRTDFSNRELIFLTVLHDKLEAEKWTKISDGLYEKTGRRVKEADIRQGLVAAKLI